MSNIVMRLRHLARRVVAFSLVGAVTLTLGIALAFRIEIQILRRRAESLLTDVSALQAQKSTFEETQRVFERWTGFREYQGACSASTCVFAVEMEDFSQRHPSLFFNRPWLLKVYTLLGGRRAGIYARVEVRDNLVQFKLFGVAIFNPDGRPAGYGVTAHAEIVNTLTVPSEHKQYEIRVPTACLDCVSVLASLTAQANSADISRLWSFDFSCLTQLMPCRSPGDLMPNAWEEFLAERADYCTGHVENEVRAAEDIGIFDVVANTTSACGRGIPCEIARVRLIQRLRGAPSFETQHIYGLNLSAPAQGRQVSPGTRLIVLFTDLFPEPDDSISPTSCGTMFLNDGNIALLPKSLTEPIRDRFLQP